MKRIISLLIYIVIVGLSLSAENNDSLGYRQLQPLEVLGVKQIPVSEISPVTRISSNMVQRYSIDRLNDISEIAPNFYIPDYGSRMTSSIYVRGLGARMDQPVVGLSIDNVPLLNKDAYDLDVADVESIDVLRGAQAILNGRNTMGGQINIRTISPWSFSGLRVTAGYGRNNDVRTTVGYYNRFSETWGNALNVAYSMNDGYYRNEYNGSKTGSERNLSLRWKLCWRPSSRLSATNVASTSLSKQSGYPYESVTTGKIAYNDTCFYRRTTFADGLTLAWTGRRVLVTSVTSMQYLDDNMTLDQDFTTDDYFTLAQKRNEWTYTEDLFTSGSRGSYDWLGGVFAFSKCGNMDAPVTFFDTGIDRLIEQHRNDMNPDYPIRWDEREFLLGNEFRQKSQGLAFYHESTYHVGDWTLQAGLRWDNEWVGLKHHSYCDTGYETLQKTENGKFEPYRHTRLKISDKGSISDYYSELLPKIAASYKFGKSTAYATVSRAYKSGGYNTQMFSDVLQQRIMQYMGVSMTYDLKDIVSYKPEKSWNYEAGIKTSSMSGRLMLEGTLFYIDCNDQQLTMFPPGLTTGRIMTNAGRTISKGLELSALFHVTEDLDVRGSYGYTHSTFKKFADAKNDYKGKRLPYAPSQTLFAGVNWSLPFEISGSRPSVNCNFRGVGDIYWNESNTIRQPFYCVVGASVSWTKKYWNIRVWGENITSTKYNTFYFMSIGNEFVQRGRPWSIGATLRLNIELD